MRSSWLSLSVLLVAWGAVGSPLAAARVSSPVHSVVPAGEQVGFGLPIPGLGGQPKQKPPQSNSTPANSGSSSPQGIRQATVSEILDGPQVFIETRQAQAQKTALRAAATRRARPGPPTEVRRERTAPELGLGI